VLIPQEVFGEDGKGEYCIRVEVHRSTKETYARGWTFDSVGFIKSKTAPKIGTRRAKTSRAAKPIGAAKPSGAA